MTITRFILTAASVLILLAACSAASKAHLIPASAVIELKAHGADEVTLLAWVNDPTRWFRFTEEGVADLLAAGVSEKVINAMLAKSEVSHENDEQEEDHDHHH